MRHMFESHSSSELPFVSYSHVEMMSMDVYTVIVIVSTFNMCLCEYLCVKRVCKYDQICIGYIKLL